MVYKTDTTPSYVMGKADTKNKMFVVNAIGWKTGCTGDVYRGN
jgi:hypothetical protein